MLTRVMRLQMSQVKKWLVLSVPWNKLILDGFELLFSSSQSIFIRFGVCFVPLFYTTFSAFREVERSSWRISLNVTLRLSQQLYLCNRRKLWSRGFLFWLMVAVQNIHLSAQILILKGWRPGSLWFLFFFQKNFNLLIFRAYKKLLLDSGFTYCQFYLQVKKIE